MRIGLDARTLTAPRPRGTGRVFLDAYRLVPRLRPEWEFVLYHRRPLPDDWHNDPTGLLCLPNVRLRRSDCPGDRFDAWFQVRLPFAARRDGVSLLHLPASAAPAWCPAPCVVTIHDLIPLTLPGEATPAQRRAFRRGVVRAVRRAVHIVTPSAATRDAVHDEFAVPLERLTVVPWAPDARLVAALALERGAAAAAAVRAKYRLGRPWLLGFSGRSPRKNTLGLVRGFAAARVEARRETGLALIGCEPANYREELEDVIRGLGLSDRCRVLGYVPHTDLPGLLAGARGVVMPSLAEGFGLPILDAFACGVPVLTSNVSSMPEVGGDAVVYCDPRDTQSIARGIEELLDEVRAAVLVQRGRARVAQFTWRRTAEALCAVYERCRGESSASAHEAAVCEAGT